VRGSTERTKKLREISTGKKPSLNLERALIMTDFYKENFGKYSIPVMRALTLKEILDKKSISIEEGELIVGEKGATAQEAPTYPELCCHTMEDLEILQNRKYISFRISEEDIRKHEKEIIPFWKDRSIRKKILDNMSEKWKDCYHAGIFTEFMEQRAPGHTVANDKIYKYGFLDLKEKIKNELDKIDSLNDRDSYSKKEELKAMSIACDAIINYSKRYVKLALEMADGETDEKKKADLLLIAENCKVVPAHRPQTFLQALQMYWFVHIGVTTELNTWDSFSPGRLDQYLFSFYCAEKEKGDIDYAKAREYLELLWIKFNNQPAPPKVGITMKESATYTDFANINTGGINPYTGNDGVNELSYIILDVMDEMKLLQPSSNVQISTKTPNRFLERACEVSRKGWGQPAFYNTEELIQELVVAGKDIDDARFGGSSGCVETGAHGKEAYILTGYFNIPKILEITLNNGFDPVSKKQLGLKTGSIEELETYEKLYDAFEKQLNYFIDIKIEGNNTIESIYAKEMPGPFMSLLIDDCISNGRDYNAGGSKYNTRYIQGVGIGTITDSLVSLKYNVYDRGIFSLREIKEAMDCNFENMGEMKNALLNDTPKYGNDDDYADDVMKEVFKTFYNAVSDRDTVCGGKYRIDMLPTTCHVYFGSVTGATPNGRSAFKPLTDGISPEKGADKNGPTSVLKSASKMDHVKTGGTLLNQKFSPAVLEGETGIKNLSALIRAYFKLGGHHIQFNVIDKKTLVAAQKNPEDYEDLIVRVAGYSDHFNNLEKALQDEIIERTEQTVF